ncbi:MAG: alanine racemase [Deltaproteobacteria bacterium]|jgi:alanine racemase|nr:alanine racemase [Deltaproteobacteria bacterium]
MFSDLSFNRVEIDLAALKANFRLIRQLNPLRPLMAVVKGDAYGHGLIECAQALVEDGATDLGVLDAAEGVSLRLAQRGNQSRPVDIHVLAGLRTPAQLRAAVEHDLVTVIHSLPQLHLLEEMVPAGSKAQVYLKIDSGMGRLGLPWWEAPTVLPSLLQKPKIIFRGLMTHLATVGDPQAQTQLARFQKIQRVDQQLNLTQGRHSALASPGLLAHPDYPDQFSRVGLAMYGANPLEGDEEKLTEAGARLTKKLKPALSFYSQIIQVRTIRAGETISYDRTFVAPANLKVAAAPVGYVHGLTRARSNQGGALINGRLAPSLGRVCMNLSLYDVSQIPDAQPGQKVTLVGRDGRARISVGQAAQWQSTSAYECLCLFGRLNPRAYQEGA